MAIEAFVPPDAARVATVYTNAPKRLRRAVFADLCTLLCSHACPRRRNHTNAPERRRGAVFADLCTLLCPHGRSCDRVGPRVPRRRRPHGPVMPGRSDLRPTPRRRRNHQPIRVREAKRHCLHMGGGTFALPGAPLAARCPRMSQARHARDAKQGQFGWASRLVRFNAWGL